METRKVQLTGGSSYVVTLPKEWIKSLKISKNDIVGVEIQQDGSLLVIPKKDIQKLQKVKEFDVTSIDNPTFLFRYLIGAYEAGFSEIRLISTKKMPLFVRPVVREFTQMTIGQEVIEESESSVTLKDLLNPAEMPFKNTIQRMYIITKNMHENIQSALKKKDRDIIETVISGDNDIDRLYWLVGRQYSIILRDPTLAKKMDIGPEEASYYYLVSRLIERIADHYVRMGENISNLIQEKIDERTYRKFVDVIIPASDMALDIFDNSIKSFIKKDLKSANKTIESIKKLTARCEKINDIAMKQKGINALSMGYIEESIRRIGEYSGDLSEFVINYLIRE